MSDLEVSCPHCEEKSKLHRIGLEVKGFIQCPHCRGVIKLDLAVLDGKAVRVDHDFVD